MKKTTTPKQFEILVNYLQHHTDLAVGFANSSEAKMRRRQMWIRLTDKLNQYGPPIRNCIEWKSIWSDYKYNLKRKLAADLKLARRKNCNKRLPFNNTEQTVINLLGIRDKLVNGDGNREGLIPLQENQADPLTDNSISPQQNIAESDIEIDDNKEGIVISNDFDLAADIPVTEYVEPEPILAEPEYMEAEGPAESDVNVSAMLKDTLMAMQKTQQAILKELKESNRYKRNSQEIKERLLQIEQEKLNEKKLQNYEENKQAYMQIELKRRELELYELKLKGLCTQCTIKIEND